MTDQLIPTSLPPTLGSSSRNGDRCRWQTQSALEQACQHLGLYVRRPQPNLCAPATISANTTWRFLYNREPYTAQMVAVICYSTSSPNVSAVFSVVSPIDPGSVTIAGTATSAASSHQIARVPVIAGDIESSDATIEAFTCEVKTITSSDPEETTPTVTVWSMHWTTDRLGAANIT